MKQKQSTDTQNMVRPYMFSSNTKSDAFNLVENLLVFDEIGVNEYQALKTVLSMLNKENAINLGEGMHIALVDKQTS